VENIELRPLWWIVVNLGFFLGFIGSSAPNLRHLLSGLVHFLMVKTWTDRGELHGLRGQGTGTFSLPGRDGLGKLLLSLT
jgi:hypothetical protein